MSTPSTSVSAGTRSRRRADQPDELSQALLDISALLDSPEPLDAVLRRFVDITAELMQMPICSLYLLESDQTLRKRSNVGLDQDLSLQATFRLGEGIPGWVAQHGQLVALPDITQDPRYTAHPHRVPEPHAYICAPLKAGDRTIGVLSARIMRVKTFTRTECRVFQTVARMIAIVLEKQRWIEERMRAQHLAAIATSLSEVAHYAKNVMFTAQVAEKVVGDAIERTPGLEAIRPSWQNLKRANQRIRKLVGDMLTFSRERALRLEPADVNALVREAADDLRDHATRHRTAVVLDLAPDLPPARVDRDVLHDVLLNLLSNAIDAIPQEREGRVIARTRMLSPDRYRIEVEDNGVGIPAEVRERIFHLFFSTKGERGTGIGLAATRKAVERHGGRIEFESEPGRGAVFRVDLPVNPPAALPAAAIREEPGASPSGGPGQPQATPGRSPTP